MGRKRRTIPWIGVRDKVYYVHWFDEQARRTKRLSLGTTDTLEAQNRYAAFLAEGHKIFNPSSSAAGLTVRQALDQYKTEHIDINAVDRVRAESAIRHLRAFFGDRPLHEIDIPASRAFSRKIASYLPRPRLRSQTTMSMTAPTIGVGVHHVAGIRGCPGWRWGSRGFAKPGEVRWQ
jgi:hypothetical protein